jgi:outer membrane lipoprotein carrier protein
MEHPAIWLRRVWLLAMLWAGAAGAAAAGPAELEAVLDRLEARYDVPGFAAVFSQESTVKAMEITDTAAGRVLIRRPNMMRWEYTRPEPQLIVSDGEALTVHRPADNQVLTGKAPALFGDGKGAGFLADMRLLRRKFHAELLEGGDERLQRLKLQPLEKTIDIVEVELSLDRESGLVQRIVTRNAYGDVTRIELSGTRFFSQPPDPAQFRFDIPPGAEVLPLQER